MSIEEFLIVLVAFVFFIELLLVFFLRYSNQRLTERIKNVEEKTDNLSDNHSRTLKKTVDYNNKLRERLRLIDEELSKTEKEAEKQLVSAKSR